MKVVNSRLQTAKLEEENGSLTKYQVAHIIGECLVDTYIEFGEYAMLNVISNHINDVKFAIETNDFVQGLYERIENLGYYGNAGENVITKISNTLTNLVA